jgi:hypothetical protein
MNFYTIGVYGKTETDFFTALGNPTFITPISLK